MELSSDIGGQGDEDMAEEDSLPDVMLQAADYMNSNGYLMFINAT